MRDLLLFAFFLLDASFIGYLLEIDDFRRRL